MKKASNVLFILMSAILALVSLAFVIIEGRLLISFDWSLYEHEFIGFIQYLARVGLALLCLATSISSIFYLGRKSFIFEGACVLAIAIAISTGATNGIGLYLIVIATLYLASAVFNYIVPESEE